jgi:hypothetical protein
MAKYLDLAGLTAYDTKIKEWIKSGLVDITDDEILALFATSDGYNLIALKKVDISNITYEEVDLGLKSGLKWANKNIGAQTVEDYGTYFSWGNTDGYTISGTKFLTVDEACQLFSSVTGQTLTTKEELENMLGQMGITVDNLGTVDGYSFDEAAYSGTSGAGFTGDVLDSTHDAATSIMGDSWRMPTSEEYQELVNAVKSSDGTKGILTCQYEYIDLNGEQQSLVVYNDAESGYFSVKGLIVNDSPVFKTILGIRFTNDVSGASVYFPACGGVDGSILANFGFFGIYWSSSIDDTTSARYFYFIPKDVSASNSFNSYYGLCVRGVHV